MATSTTFSKTGGTALLAHTQLASATIVVGSWVDVAALLAARVFVSLGRTATTALSNEVLFRLQGSAKDSGDDEAFDIYRFTSLTGKTSANAPTLSGATSAGATTFAVSSATGITAGDNLYIRETGTPANSEWSDVKSISGTTVTPFNNLTRAHTNGVTITDLAERFSWQESLAGVKRLRLIADAVSNGNSGVTVDVMAWLMTLDSLSTT